MSVMDVSIDSLPLDARRWTLAATEIKEEEFDGKWKTSNGQAHEDG
jgi:hypothetical protein